MSVDGQEGSSGIEGRAQVGEDRGRVVEMREQVGKEREVGQGGKCFSITRLVE